MNTVDSGLAVEDPSNHESATTVEEAPSRLRPRVLVLASTFPSAIQPIHGVFVKERVKAVAARGDFDVRVVSPTPWFPPLKMFPRWYPLSQIPARETVEGLQVMRPRYALAPKIGGYLHARLMSWGIGNSIARLRQEFPFDLIDAHFVYPDGVVGAMLGERYHVPVVMTARGEDMIRFPDLPVIGPAIRWGLKRASQLVGLSEELAQKMRENGGDPQRIRVISNGVDTAKFRPVPCDEARLRLGLPAGRKMIIGVGYLLERKGFHLAVEALRTVREQHPDAMLIIVGGVARWGQDYSAEIRETIRRTGLEDHVRLVGARPPDELYLWYSSADLFTILSSREGSPNAPLEALACGVPIVATPIGSIPQVLSRQGLGLMLPERSAQAAARGLSDALAMTWDRAAIRAWAVENSWGSVAEQVAATFRDALRERSGQWLPDRAR
ncbi:MAG: glycosyltransferase family 4 protein [Planctomycetaceae bacterium]|nr:MAG: glycosyltransferase family 4 protein [Planctomycetaceae bacterium]